MKQRGPDRRKSSGRRAGDNRPPLVTCPHCNSIVPAGDFCGHCGAHLPTGSTTRRHAFAAVPSEHVVHLSIVSTLFPHLPHRRGAPFRIGLVVGGAVVLLLAAFHLFATATVVAVFVLPILYLMYLYEVEIYEEEPWLVIGATMVVGAVLGVAFTRVSGDSLAMLRLTEDRETAFVLAGIGIPIAAQALMLVGPVFLYLFRERFREPLDGLAFGAASALGFTLGSSLTAFWPLIVGPIVGSGSAIDWAVRLTRAGLLVSLVNASTTALVAAAIWLQRYDRRRSGRPWQSSILASLVVAFGVQVLLAIIAFLVPDLIADVTVLGLATIALLLFVRLVIHQSLLAEGAEHEIGPDSMCPECHRIVPTMVFCPSCGAARAAAAKYTRPRPATGST